MIVCLQTINQIIVALYLVNHDITSKATIDLLIVALILYYVIYCKQVNYYHANEWHGLSYLCKQPMREQ